MLFLDIKNDCGSRQRPWRLRTGRNNRRSRRKSKWTQDRRGLRQGKLRRTALSRKKSSLFTVTRSAKTWKHHIALWNISQILHGTWGPTRRVVGTDLLPLSGRVKEVPPNPTWVEVLRIPLIASQYDWFAGRMIPIHPEQTTCRGRAEFPIFLKPTTHMVLTSLSRFLLIDCGWGTSSSRCPWGRPPRRPEDPDRMQTHRKQRHYSNTSTGRHPTFKLEGCVPM